VKIVCNFNKDFRALFSNIGNSDKNAFSLLMTYHKSQKGGFGTEISVEQCNELLKRENKQFYCVDYSEGAKI